MQIQETPRVVDVVVAITLQLNLVMLLHPQIRKIIEARSLVVAPQNLPPTIVHYAESATTLVM